MDRVPKWEPKPGDVAMVNRPGISPRRATWATACPKENHPEGPHWHIADRQTYLPASAHGLVVRPLVVIDPEDEGLPIAHELWERLENLGTRDFRVWRHHIREVLREYANPKPRIEEPRGLGAVVEAINDNYFIRVGEAGWVHAEDATSEPVDWNDIAAVRVVSDGMAADV